MGGLVGENKSCMVLSVCFTGLILLLRASWVSCCLMQLYTGTMLRWCKAAKGEGLVPSVIYCVFIENGPLTHTAIKLAVLPFTNRLLE